MRSVENELLVVAFQGWRHSDQQASLPSHWITKSCLVNDAVSCVAEMGISGISLMPFPLPTIPVSLEEPS